MAICPNTAQSPFAQDPCADVLWINTAAIEQMRETLTVSQIGMAWMLAAIIATEGPVRVADVRKVLNVPSRKWGLPINRLGYLFVVSDGLVMLNDYAFVPEGGAE